MTRRVRLHEGSKQAESKRKSHRDVRSGVAGQVSGYTSRRIASELRWGLLRSGCITRVSRRDTEDTPDPPWCRMGCRETRSGEAFNPICERFVWAEFRDVRPCQPFQLHSCSGCLCLGCPPRVESACDGAPMVAGRPRDNHRVTLPSQPLCLRFHHHALPNSTRRGHDGRYSLAPGGSHLPATAALETPTRPARSRRVYDHRFRAFVVETGDLKLAKAAGVPRLTSASWKQRGLPEVVSLEITSREEIELRLEVLKLRERNKLLVTIVRLLFMLVRLAGARLEGIRLEAATKTEVLSAIERAKARIPLAVVLHTFGISASRYHAWRRQERICLADAGGKPCPRKMPNRLTTGEVMTMREMVLDKALRHMKLATLAVFAQRTSRLFAHASTWARMVREHGWIRPRHRVYPAKPKDAKSGASRSPIPVEADHRFRGKPITDSG